MYVENPVLRSIWDCGERRGKELTGGLEEVFEVQLGRSWGVRSTLESGSKDRLA